MRIGYFQYNLFFVGNKVKYAPFVHLLESILKSVPKSIFNKVDLYGDTHREKLDQLIEIYKNIGYPSLEASGKTGLNIKSIKDLIENKICVFSGNSGVGKSTLINSIYPGFNLKTGIISDYHQKGKHTTTFAEMFCLNNGGYIIDTPGIKGFGVIDMEKENISIYFPEMLRLISNCQFYNCTHTHEPNCAVKLAISSGQIAESRYSSYLSLLEVDGKYRRR